MEMVLPDLRAGTVEVSDPLMYSAYARMTWTALSHLEIYYRRNSNGETSEAESMAIFVEKIIQTTRALELKHRFNKDNAGHPIIAASGFPYTFDIRDLQADLASAHERIPKLPTVEFSREKLLDLIMVGKPDPKLEDGVALARYEEERDRLLWQIAERAYFDSLDLRKQFFYFTPGKLFPVPPEEWHGREVGRRAYRFSWGCWDPETHKPCVYFLLFTQDETEPALTDDSPEYAQFLRAVERVGTRAPKQLAVVFAQLDEFSSNFIHPKMLKRIMFGPLISPLLYKDKEPAAIPPLVAQLSPVFTECSAIEDESVLFFSTEFVFSSGEHTPSGTLAQRLFGSHEPKLRQVFTIPRTDRSLSLQTYAILSHRLRQHLSEELIASVPELSGVEFLAFDEETKGVAHVG